MNRKHLIQRTLVLSSFMLIIMKSYSQTGYLDITFDVDGIVTTAIGNHDDFANSIAIQSDNKIVVSGHSNNGFKNDFAIARYNLNGSLDNTFSLDGKATTSIGSSHDHGYSIALQADGKIVVAGDTYNSPFPNFALVRYNTNGDIDTNFDGDGIVTSAVASNGSIAYSVAIQSDGKILAAGGSVVDSTFDFAVVRYNSNGSLDNSFDTDGIVITPGPFHEIGRSLAVQNDGKILLAGSSQLNSKYNFSLVRYNSDGSLDLNFGSNGKVLVAIDSVDDEAFSVCIQLDGKIIVVGNTFNGVYTRIALVRFNTDGSIDSTFDNDGRVITSIGNASAGSAVKIQADGKILVSGSSNNGSTTKFTLVRYNTNGSLDSTFNIDGKVETSIGNTCGARTLAIQSDGKIVLGGGSFDGTYNDFALSRYNVASAIGINNYDIQNIEIKIYPNPFTSLAILKTKNPMKEATITIYNAFGQVVRKFCNISGENVILNRENLVNGFYLIQLIQDNKIISTSRIFITD